MEAASRYAAPTCGELERLTVPMGVASATDDPVHPLEVGLEWVAAAPRAALRTVTLEEMGVDPSALGKACVAALLDV
jgi:pimeloyl-ACP methyl ester carboxylesterase